MTALQERHRSATTEVLLGVCVCVCEGVLEDVNNSVQRVQTDTSASRTSYNIAQE